MTKPDIAYLRMLLARSRIQRGVVMNDWPTPSALMSFHFDCLQGLYFDHRERREAGSLLRSELIRDPYYNFFAPSDGAEWSAIAEGARELLSSGRSPAVYLDAAARAQMLEPLREGEYELYGTDAWMGVDLPIPDAVVLPSTVAIETVDERGVEAYVAAFRAAYSGSTEDDPYGTLDEGYSTALRRSLCSSAPSGFERWFVQAVEGNDVIGVASLLIKDDTAGCYGVGVVPSQRRRGVGRGLMDHLAAAAARSGVRRIFLQTEAGSSVEELYRSFGYRSLFQAGYFVQGTE
jgi:GNAT superfamily N-acetyltransferase